MKKHDAALRRTYGPALKTIIARIERTFAKATPSDIEAGAEWYPNANAIAGDLAIQSGYRKDTCAAVIAHLSPRTKWDRNVLAAHMFLVDKEVLPGTMGRALARATDALDIASRELSVEHSFGKDAKKTLRFYQNIMGDHEVVTVDIWALRACGLDDQYITRAGVYEALEYAYQVVARRHGLEPATLQATCWVVARGGRAD